MLFDHLTDKDVGPRQKLLEAHTRLCQAYHCPIAYFHNLDPLSELISSLLSHRTKNADSGRAFKALRTRYPTWESLRDAPVDEVQSTIPMVTWPEQKAPRLQQVLRAVTTLHGTLSLDFLATMDPAAARAWLGQLPGVGPKTSAAVLSFSTLRAKALPVDSHHHRVATRLGILPLRMAVGESHHYMESMLPPDWTAQQVYDHHEVFMLHGQRCCYFANPDCHRCPLLDLCPTGQSRTTPGRPPATPTHKPPGADA